VIEQRGNDNSQEAGVVGRLECARRFRRIAEQLDSNAAKSQNELPDRCRLLSKIGLLFGSAVDEGYYHSLRYVSGLVEEARVKPVDAKDEGRSIYLALIGPRGARVLGNQGLSSDGLNDVSDAGSCRRLARILEHEHEHQPVDTNIGSTEVDSKQAAEIVSYDDICTLLVIKKHRLQNVVSEWRKEGHVINDPCRYEIIRPLLLEKWPNKAELFPDTFTAFKVILGERKEAK